MVPSGSLLRTISDVIDYRAGLRPQSPAIVGTGFDAFSFQELSLHIRTIKQQLQAAGVKQSARVGILLPKGPEATLLSLSIASSAISVPINPMLNPRELEEELPRLGLDAVILPTWQRSPAWELVSS